MNYNQLYELTLNTGEKCLAKLVHINTQFNSRCKEPDVWRREVDVPGKKRHVQMKDVKEWRTV